MQATLLIVFLALCACDTQRNRLGATLFHEGIGERGAARIEQGPRWMSYGTFGCATCHGETGAGRFVKAGIISASAPAITKAALASRGYDADTLQRAIVQGVAVDGRTFSYYMPRWQLNDKELHALLQYLGTLSP